jgi:two-component system, LuxR family, response regulator FixJ
MAASDSTVYVAVCRSVESLLGSVEIESVTYASRAEFLECAPTLPEGCVLLDVMMDGMSGTRLLELGMLLPVVMMTSRGDVQIAVKCLKAGAVARWISLRRPSQARRCWMP